MTKLYRGISVMNDKALNGKLIPSGSNTEIVMKYGDEGLRYDGKFVYGESKNNTARAHQVESGMHSGSCISTTRDIKIAEYFATSGNIEDGYIYIIDEDKLSQYDVSKYEFSDSENPHENEVTLMSNDGGEIPLGVILKKIKVSCS